MCNGKVDLGILTEGGIDIGIPTSGKIGSTGVITSSVGLGVGLFAGAGASVTGLSGFQVSECGDTSLYDR